MRFLVAKPVFVAACVELEVMQNSMIELFSTRNFYDFLVKQLLIRVVA